LVDSTHSEWLWVELNPWSSFECSCDLWCLVYVKLRVEWLVVVVRDEKFLWDFVELFARECPVDGD
jgi:hypothetical protein